MASFWRFLEILLNRMPGWPSERQSVTMGLYGLTVLMLFMAVYNPGLWEVEVFKVLIQAFGITGVLNLIAGYYFSANKDAEQQQHSNTKAFEAITAAANAGNSTDPNTIKEGDEVVLEKKNG